MPRGHRLPHLRRQSRSQLQSPQLVLLDVSQPFAQRLSAELLQTKVQLLTSGLYPGVGLIGDKRFENSTITACPFRVALFRCDYAKGVRVRPLLQTMLKQRQHPSPGASLLRLSLLLEVGDLLTVVVQHRKEKLVKTWEPIYKVTSKPDHGARA
jgi:hypothetical protein